MKTWIPIQHLGWSCYYPAWVAWYIHHHIYIPPTVDTYQYRIYFIYMGCVFRELGWTLGSEGEHLSHVYKTDAILIRINHTGPYTPLHHTWLSCCAPVWSSMVHWPLQDNRLFRGCRECSNHPFIPPRPPALPTLVQYYCTTIGQYTTPPPTSRLYAIHHTILVITISCKGQMVQWCMCTMRPRLE